MAGLIACFLRLDPVWMVLIGFSVVLIVLLIVLAITESRSYNR